MHEEFKSNLNVSRSVARKNEGFRCGIRGVAGCPRRGGSGKRAVGILFLILSRGSREGEASPLVCFYFLFFCEENFYFIGKFKKGNFMKKLLALGMAAALLAGCNDLGAKSGKTSLVTEKDKYSYALGANFGSQAHYQLVTRDSVALDLDAFYQGFKERYLADSANYLMNDSLVYATLNAFSQDLQKKKMEKDSIASAKNLAEQEEFLAKNKTAEGVITTESGLQYKVITEGNGAIPTDSSIVSVHYTGTLLNGKEFDSSVKRGQPAEFPVGAVIPGWTELLKLMKVGGKVQAWIPSALGYGPSGRQPMIPGNSLLIFEVELLEIKAPAAK